MTTTEPLAGRVIAVAESRELEVLAALLERRGAHVLRYPMVTIVDAPDPAALLEWSHRITEGQCDDLILLTGGGLRRLVACIERHEPALRGAFIEALARLRKITRGPKPARALRELGLSSDLAALEPTTAGVIAALSALDLRGRRIAVQLYGDEPNRLLIDFLERAGAHVLPVAPYRYADGASGDRLGELLVRMRAGAVDAIVFTSKSQVERLFRAASADQVREALAATQVAAVGPVVAEALAARGAAVGAMPQHSWFMKPLTAALSAALTSTSAADKPGTA
jgi:uroporphyrinogen-III synthase